jgi:hypothetical protein
MPRQGCCETNASGASGRVFPTSFPTRVLGAWPASLFADLITMADGEQLVAFVAWLDLSTYTTRLAAARSRVPLLGTAQSVRRMANPPRLGPVFSTIQATLAWAVTDPTPKGTRRI